MTTIVIHLGDHPCTMQYPLSLDWEHAVTVQEYAVDDYVTSQRQAAYAQEYGVPFASSSASSASSYLLALRLSRTERYQRLLNVTGWSREELEQREAERQLTLVEEEEGLWMAQGDQEDDDENEDDDDEEEEEQDDDDDDSFSSSSSAAAAVDDAANADAYFAALRSRTSVAPTIGWDD